MLQDHDVDEKFRLSTRRCSSNLMNMSWAGHSVAQNPIV